ncbi:TrkH family potassium uptake protein [soil metagenome]
MGLLGLAAVMCFFCAYALLVREDAICFAAAGLAAGAAGALLARVGSKEAEPSRREAIIGVLLLWLTIPAFGAVPFAVSGGMSPLNALFESMSGFTTTGATVLQDFGSFTSSLFMWRALSQWFGGVGIIVLFIAVLPQLAIAGRQLFFTEAPGPTEEKLTPRLRNTSNAVLIVYVGLTVLCVLAYALAGMSFYDALAHAFTTLAAGGFSPQPLSFQGFASPALEWISVVFMAFAGANFALLYRAVTGRPRTLWRDAEFKAYLGIATVAALAVAFGLRDLYGPGEAVRQGFFQSLSILTTTGYASADFAVWPRGPQVVLLMLMFIGGSAGSAGGGIKVVRWLMLVQNTMREVRRTLHPRAVLPVRVGNRVVPEEVLRAVSAFITLYIGLFAVTTAVVTVLGADFVTAFTASIACIGNIGPGLNSVGPMASFADLHPVSRGMLIFAMYAGRLEVVTVFVVFDPQWWRLPRGWLARG